jgi:antagonist of KipI
MEVCGDGRRRREAMVTGLKTIRPGLFTTVQDLGRWGVSRWGIPVSGAADSFSARTANQLAGNEETAALLEITLGSAEFESIGGVAVGIAGASAVVTIGGVAAERRRTLFLRDGERIAIGPAEAGFRVYLAISGGIDVPRVLGSRSTLSASGFGGFRGRKLAPGDTLASIDTSPPESREMPAKVSLAPFSSGELRVLPGPQSGRFPEDSRRRFFQNSFRISSRSDRRGLRLEGEGAPASPGEIAPEGVVVGAVQVPPGGDPIVLMPDGPVTGGYPKIAVAIRADRRVLGQWRPGQVVRFRQVTREEAVAAWKEQEASWTQW